MGYADVAVLYAGPQRAEHGIVFTNGGDDVVSRPKDAVNCKVQGVGPVGGEHDLLWLIGPN